MVSREPKRLNTSSFQSGLSGSRTIVSPIWASSGRDWAWISGGWGWVGRGVLGGVSLAQQRNAQVPQDLGLCLPDWTLLPKIFISRQAPHRLLSMGTSTPWPDAQSWCPICVLTEVQLLPSHLSQALRFS